MLERDLRGGVVAPLRPVFTHDAVVSFSSLKGRKCSRRHAATQALGPLLRNTRGRRGPAGGRRGLRTGARGRRRRRAGAAIGWTKGRVRGSPEKSHRGRQESAGRARRVPRPRTLLVSGWSARAAGRGVGARFTEEASRGLRRAAVPTLVPVSLHKEVRRLQRCGEGRGGRGRRGRGRGRRQGGAIASAPSCGGAFTPSTRLVPHARPNALAGRGQYRLPKI